MKIAIFGMGGIGGSIGGALARKYPEDITFIARGERGRHFAEKGITVEGDYLGSFTAMPAQVTDTPAEAGVQDVVFVCVKAPALAEAAEAIRPMVGKDTVLVAAMNGLLPARELAEIYSKNPVTQALIYVIALKGPDFSVIQKGKFANMAMSTLEGNEKMAKLAEMLNASGYDTKLVEDLDVALWDKYIFNCAYNTMTAALSCRSGLLKEEPQLSDFKAIVKEGIAAAEAEGIKFDYDMAGKAEYKLLHTSGDSGSSLQRDVDEGKKGEMEMFSGDMIRIGGARGVEMPTLTKYYEMLKARFE